MSLENDSLTLESLISVFTALLFLMLPFLQFALLVMVRGRIIRDECFRRKIISFFEGLRFQQVDVFIFASFILFRKTALAVIIVFSAESSFIFQINVLFIMSMALSIYMQHRNPFVLKEKLRISIFNEEVFLLCLVVILLFSDFVESPHTRYSIGWAYLALVTLCLLINLSLMVKNMAKSFSAYCKEKIANKKQKSIFSRK